MMMESESLPYELMTLDESRWDVLIALTVDPMIHMSSCFIELQLMERTVTLPKVLLDPSFPALPILPSSLFSRTSLSRDTQPDRSSWDQSADCGCPNLYFDLHSSYQLACASRSILATRRCSRYEHRMNS